MRASIAIAASLAGLVAGSVGVRAADLPVATYRSGESGYGSCCGALPGPVPQVVIADVEPGVVVRHWWCPPWRNRHYYPHGRVVLRSEAVPPHTTGRATPRPAPHYMRYWTNVEADVAPLIGPDVALPTPRPRPYPYPYRNRPSPPPAVAP